MPKLMRLSQQKKTRSLEEEDTSGPIQEDQHFFLRLRIHTKRSKNFESGLAEMSMEQKLAKTLRAKDFT